MLNPLEKSLLSVERKKSKDLDACLQKLQNLPPFIVPVDGLLSIEAESMLKRLASGLTTKWRQPYYMTCGYIHIRVSIKIMRAPRIPS